MSKIINNTDLPDDVFISKFEELKIQYPELEDHRIAERIWTEHMANNEEAQGEGV